MADSVSGDAAFLGGVEIVNTARTIAYLEAGIGPSSLNVRADCGCPDLIDLIGCDEQYIDPMTDNAPWFSEDHPESADFAGFFMTEFEGLSSTFERSADDNIIDGGSLGRSRVGPKTLTWRGFLFGATCCAVSYGFRWLTHVLRSPSSCGGCVGQDLELLVCCPAVDDIEGVTGVEAFRTMKNVALLEGPTILSERRASASCDGVGGGCGGSVIMEIEFSLYAAIPWLFRREVPLVNCISFLDNAVERFTVDEPPCPPINCGDEFFNIYLQGQGCPVPELPPTATYSLDCIDPPERESAVYITVPRSSWREFEEAVPYIVINTGPFFMVNFELGFYSSSSGDPCGDLANNAPECDLICEKLRILALPANSKFIIDGRTRTMSLVCDTNVAFPGERYTLGAFGWPVFSCYGFCLEATFSLDDESFAPYLGNGCISVSVVPRTL